jgi:hypothetical protein
MEKGRGRGGGETGGKQAATYLVFLWLRHTLDFFTATPSRITDKRGFIIPQGEAHAVVGEAVVIFEVEPAPTLAFTREPFQRLFLWREVWIVLAETAVYYPTRLVSVHEGR